MLQLFHPYAQPSLGKQRVLCHFPFSQHRDPAARQPFPQLPMTICFMSSLLPCPVSRLSLYSCAISLDAAFFPITSCLIQTFLKAPFHASQLPRVLPRLGRTLTEAPPPPSRGQPSPSPTPHSGNYNTHFHIKSHPLYLSHKSFLKVDKISSIKDK